MATSIPPLMAISNSPMKQIQGDEKNHLHSMRYSLKKTLSDSKGGEKSPATSGGLKSGHSGIRRRINEY